MATCIKCRASISDGSLFCNYCGAKQELTCPSCGAALSTDSRFCNRCGAPVAGGGEKAAPQVCATRPSGTKLEDFRNRGTSVGNAKYHFVFKSGKIYQVSRTGVETEVPNMPNKGFMNYSLHEPLVWAEDRLWCEVSDLVDYRLYSLDPEKLEWSSVIQINKKDPEELKWSGARNPMFIGDELSYYSTRQRNYTYNTISGPYIAGDVLYFHASHKVGYDFDIIRINRTTGEAVRLNTGRFGPVKAVGEKLIWVGKFAGLDCAEAPVLMDWQGSWTLLYEHPEFAPLMPRIAELTGETLPHDQDYGKMNQFVKKHIQYIDFQERLVYVCRDTKDPTEHIDYTLPFGGADEPEV